MKQAFHILTVPTKGPGLYEFTEEAASFARGEKIADGLLTCFVRHTSASLVIQENPIRMCRRICTISSPISRPAA